jgi:general nucleoside transport system ATP-binding protein
MDQKTPAKYAYLFTNSGMMNIRGYCDICHIGNYYAYAMINISYCHNIRQYDECHLAPTIRGKPMTIILKMEGITKRFPGVIASDDVDFELHEGEIHALLGENGAGKTTLMNVLYGLYAQDSGEIFVRGKSKRIRSPHHAIEAGIGMVHQHFKLVPNLTVTENIVLGQEIVNGPFLNQKKARQRIVELTNEFGIDVNPDRRIDELSVGERQRVEILKILYRGADILILDEPTAVLTPPEVEPLMNTLKSMVKSGKSIIFISHKLKEVKALTDRTTVLRRGKLIGTVNTADSTEAQLAEMMVGRNVVLRVFREKQADGDGKIVASLRHVHVTGSHGQMAVKNLDLDLPAGQIVCIAGVDGNGQSELAEALAGIRRVEEGHITLDGEDITRTNVKERLEAGLWYVPADRNHRGAATSLPLNMNAVLKHHRWEPYSKYGVLSNEAISELTNRLITEYDVRCASVSVKAGTLSGGNLQKLIVARETISKPKILLAEQPTRGLDVSAIEFVRKLLLKQREEGAAVLLISADLDEVLALADRIVVMYEGRIVYQCDREDVDMDRLGLAMAGLQQEEVA